VLKKFGSLRKALQEAGLTPIRFNKATKDELCSMLIQLWTQTLEKHGRSPYRSELKSFGFAVSGDTYIRRFGTRNTALLAAAETVIQDAEGSNSGETSGQEPACRVDRRSLSVRKRSSFLGATATNATCAVGPALNSR